MEKEHQREEQEALVQFSRQIKERVKKGDRICLVSQKAKAMQSDLGGDQPRQFIIPELPEFRLMLNSFWEFWR